MLATVPRPGSTFRYAMVEFITSGDCDLRRSGSNDATFAATFGAGSSHGTSWSSMADFYADFNAWLATNPSPSSLKPTAAQINEVFSHTTISSCNVGSEKAARRGTRKPLT